MSYWYVGTPYSKYPGGLRAAFQAACEQTAILIRARIPVFCPIAHTHPVAVAGGLDPFDHSVWMPVDQPLMDMARGMIFIKLPSWEISYGMRIERETFEASGKPVIEMEPGVIPDELLKLME